MPIQIDYFILAENIIIDSRFRLSIINTYDSINAERLPAVHSNLNFAARFLPGEDIKAGAKLKVQLSIKSPSGKEKIPSSNELEVGIDDPTQPATVNIQIPSIVLDEYGLYAATLRVSNRPIAKRTFNVTRGLQLDAKEK
jgi:hypothetical protein